MDHGRVRSTAVQAGGCAQKRRPSSPPRNIFLFQGDSTDEKVHREIERVTGVAFEEFDLFYTYLVMHEEFAALIRDRAKKGAYFMVYGLDKILPRYEGLRLIHPLSPLEGILAVYEKS
jgi:hypothetical protein